MTAHIDSDTNLDTNLDTNRDTNLDTGTDADMTHTSATLQTLAASGEQPGWRVLDTARAQQFTGEITFQVQPSISVYFDGGVAYHAVRAGDPSLCARLVDGGVLEPAQVERGVIRVGNVENLGRLFDRDPSIDRDAVMVVLELATDDVVTTIANTVSGPFALTAYRHHVSGVHRWFVSPGGSGEQPAQLTPVGEVAQIDGSVTDDLPRLAPTPADDGVQIEWDQPLAHDTDLVVPIHTIDDDLLAQLFGGTDTPFASAEVPPVADASAEEAVLPASPSLQITPPAELAPPAETAPSIAQSPTFDSAPDLAPPVEVLPGLDQSPLVKSAPVVEFASMPATSPNLAPPVVSEPVPVSESLPAPDLAPVSDVMLEIEPAPAIDTTPNLPAVADDVDDNFQILWPDGSEQHLTDIHIETAGDEATGVMTPPSTADESAVTHAALLEAIPEAAAVEPDARPPVVPEPEVVDASNGLRFDMPSLAVSADNVPDERQPDDVVDAVRRALEAIEAASIVPARLPMVDVGSLPAFQPTEPLRFDVVGPLAHDLGDDTVETAADTDTTRTAGSTAAVPVVSARESVLPADTTSTSAAPTVATVIRTAPVETAAPAGLGGFAPPTMKDSAEAVYARAAAVQQPSGGPASGVASVVFVDEAPDESDDRSSALKRLIGSLRRK